MEDHKIYDTSTMHIMEDQQACLDSTQTYLKFKRHPMEDQPSCLPHTKLCKIFFSCLVSFSQVRPCDS